MFLTILLVSMAVGLFVLLTSLIVLSKSHNNVEAEKNRLWAQVRNQDQTIRDLEDDVTLINTDLNNRIAEVKRLTNKLIEVQNHANMVEEDAAARINDFRKQPLIACMTDNQVQILAEMLAIHVREILNMKKEYVN